MWDFTVETTLLGLLVLLLIFLVVRNYLKKVEDWEEKRISLFLLAMALLPPVLGVFISWIVQVYNHRLFLFCAWALILILARAMHFAYEKKDKIIICLSILIILIGCFQMVNYIQNRQVEIKQNMDVLIEQQCGPVISELQGTYTSGNYYLPDCYVGYMYVGNLTDKQISSMGGDGIEPQYMFKNISELDKFKYYYYLAHEETLFREGANKTLLYDTDGLDLYLVGNYG
jgi:hypothetical protein